MAFDMTQRAFGNLRSDNGDDNPPTFTLTLTEDELDYLNFLVIEEMEAVGDMPELASLHIRISRLLGNGLHIVN